MNGKKLGCLLLCIVLTGFLVTSCISAENGESEAEVSEREKPLESQNSDRTVVSEVSLTAAYAWDYQKNIRFTMGYMDLRWPLKFRLCMENWMACRTKALPDFRRKIVCIRSSW